MSVEGFQRTLGGQSSELKKARLSGSIFKVPKVAESNANKPVTLFRIHH
jgi:hypothetical protein